MDLSIKHLTCMIQWKKTFSHGIWFAFLKWSANQPFQEKSIGVLFYLFSWNMKVSTAYHPVTNQLLLLNRTRLFINKLGQSGILNCFKCIWFNRNVNKILSESTSTNRRAFSLLIYACKRQFFWMGNGEMFLGWEKEIT